MRILNLIKSSNGVPEIIQAFPIIDDTLYQEIVEKAENYLIEMLWGPESENKLNETIKNMIHINAYQTGVTLRADGISYLLVWSYIEV